MKPDAFANASESFKRANAAFFATHPRQAAELERPARHEPLAAVEEKASHSGRFLVRVVSVRKRLLDEDNLCEKFHVDCLRYAGALPSDAPDTTHIETTQRKAGKGEAEHTLIEVFRLQ